MNYREAEAILTFVVEKMEQERVRQDLSLQRLGAISGVNRTTIGLIEKGKRSPSLLICLRIADALGLDLGELLKKAPKKSRKPAEG